MLTSARAVVTSLLAAALATLLGCASPAQPTGTPILVDPTTTRQESGGTDDILEVCQRMLASMRGDPDVQKRPAPRFILLDEDGITVDPKLNGYNARMLYNQFSRNLDRTAGGEFQFIDRKAVQRERARQLLGEVKTSGVDAAPAGSDMNLTIELIALRGGRETTVQYTFKLTNLDGITLWTDSTNIVKRG